jgi:hypothetical protein
MQLVFKALAHGVHRWNDVGDVAAGLRRTGGVRLVLCQ